MSPPGVPGVTAASGPYSGGYLKPLRLKNSGVAPVGATPSALIADDLAGVRVVDRAPASRRPRTMCPTSSRSRRASRRPHRRRCRPLEDRGAGGRGERLAGDRHPVLAVQRRLLGLLLGGRASRWQPDREQADGCYGCSASDECHRVTSWRAGPARLRVPRAVPCASRPCGCGRIHPPRVPARSRSGRLCRSRGTNT